MIGLGTAALKIFVALEPQDLRKSFQGLSELALGQLEESLSREALFVFTNRTRTRIKVLYFDGTGLWCATKSRAPQCSHWFLSGDSVSLSPALRKGLRGLRLCFGKERLGLCTPARLFNERCSSLDVRSRCLRWNPLR